MWSVLLLVELASSRDLPAVSFEDCDNLAVYIAYSLRVVCQEKEQLFGLLICSVHCLQTGGAGVKKTATQRACAGC